MLRQLNKTLAILSFSFFSIYYMCQTNALAMSYGLVSVPLETFHRKQKAENTLPGLFFSGKNKVDPANRKGVLLIHSEGRSKEDWIEFGQLLSNNGIDVLALDLRNKGQTDLKTLLEDIQSGVIFLKSNNKIKAHRVSVVSASAPSTGLTSYASASRQMALILDGLVFLNIPKQSVLALRQIKGIPIFILDEKKNNELCEGVVRCQVTNYDKTLGHGSELFKSNSFLKGEIRQKILTFLQNPYG